MIRWSPLGKPRSIRASSPFFPPAFKACFSWPACPSRRARYFGTSRLGNLNQRATRAVTPGGGWTTLKGRCNPFKGLKKRVQTPFLLGGGEGLFLVFLLCGFFFCGCFFGNFLFGTSFVFCFVCVCLSLWERICFLEMTVYHVGKNRTLDVKGPYFEHTLYN